MNTEHPPKNDKELWQSLALGRPAAPAAEYAHRARERGPFPAEAKSR